MSASHHPVVLCFRLLDDLTPDSLVEAPGSVGRHRVVRIGTDHGTKRPLTAGDVGRSEQRMGPHPFDIGAEYVGHCLDGAHFDAAHVQHQLIVAQQRFESCESRTDLTDRCGHNHHLGPVDDVARSVGAKIRGHGTGRIPRSDRDPRIEHEF